MPYQITLVASEKIRHEIQSRPEVKLLTERQREIIDYLADYLLNLPSSVPSVTLLHACVDSANADARSLEDFVESLMLPVSHLENVAICSDNSMWDPYASSLSQWAKEAKTPIKSVCVVPSDELFFSYGRYVRDLLQIRVLFLGEIGASEKLKLSLRPLVHSCKLEPLGSL